MRNSSIILLLLILSLKAFGQVQGYVLLKNNQKVKFDKFKGAKDSLIITVHGEKEKRKIPVNDVLGYYYQKEEIIFYLTPDHQFLDRVLCGKINLYNKLVAKYSAGGQPQGNNTYYYIEKDNRFENILVTNTILQNKKEKIEILKSFMNDRPEDLRILSEDFKLNERSLVETLKNYNLLSYERKVTKDTSNHSELIIYRRGKKQADQKINISINENAYSLGSNDFIKIKISANEITKICFDENRLCDLVEAPSHFKLYYELGLNSDLVYSFEQKNKVEADFYLQSIKYYHERQNKK